jgi:pilus assembly protein CpaE
MPKNKIMVNIETKNPNARKKFEQVIHATGGIGIQSPGDMRRSDLLIFELGQDVENEFAQIQSLLNSDAVGEVFLTSHNTDPAVLLQAIRTGAKEFFSQPLEEEEIRIGLERFKERRSQAKQNDPLRVGQIINVIGSKGGVGTTTVAINLAVSLAQNKSASSVALVDLNMVCGEIPTFLGFKPTYDWGAITKNIARLDAAFLMDILAKHDCGVHILPAPGYLNGHQTAVPEIMERLLGFMQGMFDFVVIDGGQAIDDTSLKVIEMADKVLLIAVLNLACLSNTNRLYNVFTDLGYLPRERFKIVVNRYQKKSAISLKDAEDGLSEKIFWTIPNDYRTTITAINQGKALSQIAPKAPVTKTLNKLAGKLRQGEKKQTKKRWYFMRKS